MQQRRLRLGDIVDDYCPRERRITNHAIVAMIDDEVKQTRCTTCDAEHEYKQARIPAQRRKKDSAAAMAASLAGAPSRKRPDTEAGEAVDAAENMDTADTSIEPLPSEPEPQSAEAVPLQASAEGESAPDSFGGAEEPEQPEPADDGPVHRRLIRATLPRPQGQAPERKTPEFTMHQRDINGNRPGRGHRRGQRHGQARAQQSSGQPSRFSGGQRPNPRHGTDQGSGQPRRRKRRR